MLQEAPPELDMNEAPDLERGDSYDSAYTADNEFTSKSLELSIAMETLKKVSISTPPRPPKNGLPMAIREWIKAKQKYKSSRECLRRPKKNYAKSYGDRESFDTRREFLIQLAVDLSHYGTPTHRLEYLLENVGQQLGLSSEFCVLPGCIIASIVCTKRNLVHYDYKKTPQGFNFAKLSEANTICSNLVSGETPIEEAFSKLRTLRDKKTMAAYSNLVLFPAVAFFICVIGFNGSWIDAAYSAFVGVMVGTIYVLGSYYPTSFGNVMEFTCAFLSTLLTNMGSTVLARYKIPLNCAKVIFSAISILLPVCFVNQGLNLTLSIMEISTRNMVCGVTRFFASLFTALLLGFGYTMADVILPGVLITPGLPLPMWQWTILFLPASCVAFCLLFEAKIKQMPIMVLVGTVGFITATLLQNYNVFHGRSEGPITSAAFLIGLISNIYARATRDIALAPVLAGIVILVPGSYSVRMTMNFMSHDSQSGMTVAFDMLVIALCITVGLFLATLVVWPIRGRRTQKQSLYSF